MSKLATEMKHTLTELLKECIRDAKSGRGGGLDPNKYPSQILCLAEMVQFTERCEEALKTHNLPNFHREMEQQLESYTSVDISSSGQGDTDAHVLDLKLKVIHFDVMEQNGVIPPDILCKIYTINNYFESSKEGQPW